MEMETMHMEWRGQGQSFKSSDVPEYSVRVNRPDDMICSQHVLLAGGRAE